MTAGIVIHAINLVNCQPKQQEQRAEQQPRVNERLTTLTHTLSFVPIKCTYQMTKDEKKRKAGQMKMK